MTSTCFGVGSVGPLRDLMKEHGVTRIEHRNGNWFFESDGNFNNPASGGVKVGNVDQLNRDLGTVFDQQNRDINPFFGRAPSGTGEGQDQAGSSYDFSEDTSFGLERHLQQALRANIEQMEPGLRIIDGGTERTVGAGRIDITAEDTAGNLVVIELKAGRAEHESVSQLLSYMGSIENPQGKSIRGILVANDFHPRTVMAAKPIPNISLRAYSYSIQFTFEDRGAP